MYVIFPADEVVYLSYGRLIYVPTATQQQQGSNQFAEPVPVPAPIPSSAHSTGSYTTCPSPSIPSTSSSNRSFRSTASSPLINGYGDHYFDQNPKSKSGKAKAKAGQIPKNKSESNLNKPRNSKELVTSNDNVFLKVPSKGTSRTEKRLSYSDFLPVHKCLKETRPSTKKSLKNNPLDFDDLFKRETTPSKGILRSSSQTQSDPTSESRLQLSGLQLTPEKSPTKKKTFFSSSPKPEPRIKRTSDFGYATKMAASDTSSLKDLTHPSYNELLKGHNGLTFKLIRTVSDFTQQLSQMYEQHAQELQHLVAGFRKKNGELRKERPSCPSTLFHTWETLLQEVEIDSQALGDIASIMGRQVSRPLLEKSFYRKIQSRKVFTHRESYEAIIGKTEEKLVKCRQEYKNAYVLYLSNPTTDTLSEYFNAHNAYVQQLHATNGMLEEYHKETLPQLLQELEDIYIDLCSTLAEAVLQGAEVVSSKAVEQCKRYDGLSAQIKNLNGATDIIHLARALPVPQGRPPVQRKIFVPPQPPAPPHEPDGEDGPAHHHHHHVAQNEHIPPPLKDELVIDRLSALQVKPSHDALRKEAGDLEATIRQIHDSLETLVKLQHRSVEASLFNKANEIQEDISMKRFDLTVAQIHLSAINSQRELFSNKLDTTDSGRERKMSNASQGSMKTKWLKAFKSLKTPPPESEKKNGSAATKELLKGDPDAHNFQENTYKKITPCDVCSQVLRGHTRQGLKCRICKINVHVDCQEKASKCTAKARLLRRQKSTSEIETRVPEMTVEEEIIGIDASYSGMPTMNRQLSSPHPTTALIDRRAAQGPSGSESSMRRRIFAGMKSLTGFGSRSRHGSPGHRSISLPEKRKSTDASGTRPFGQPLMLCPPQFENGGEMNDMTSLPPTPPSPSPSKGKLPGSLKKGAKPKK